MDVATGADVVTGAGDGEEPDPVIGAAVGTGFSDTATGAGVGATGSETVTGGGTGGVTVRCAKNPLPATGFGR